ncbi:DNA-binding protein [Halomarina oriensis]|uniref:DNA-binding protein n=1 Tax=Halomarina oriensis TaxID=671145 RepID=A0A6B0GH86_9EURY|nr:DNA-binding protein [Halomarina oriensis]MWG33131.1 DNA-binding protein [Halomarina oriensis]
MSINTRHLGITYEDLSGVQRDTLYALADVESDQQFGRAVWGHLTERREEDLSEFKFYTQLDGLVDAGLVEKDEFAIDGRTHRLELTDAAMDLLADRLEFTARSCGHEVVTRYGQMRTDGGR